MWCGNFDNMNVHASFAFGHSGGGNFVVVRVVHVRVGWAALMCIKLSACLPFIHLSLMMGNTNVKNPYTLWTTARDYMNRLYCTLGGLRRQQTFWMAVYVVYTNLHVTQYQPSWHTSAHSPWDDDDEKERTAEWGELRQRCRRRRRQCRRRESDGSGNEKPTKQMKWALPSEQMTCAHNEP